MTHDAATSESLEKAIAKLARENVELRGQVKKASDRLDRLSRIVNDILDLSKESSREECSRPSDYPLQQSLPPTESPVNQVADYLLRQAAKGCPTTPVRVPGSPELSEAELVAVTYFMICQETVTRRNLANERTKRQLLRSVYGVSQGYSSYAKLVKGTNETISDRLDRAMKAVNDLFGIDRVAQKATRAEERKAKVLERQQNPLRLKDEEAKQLYLEMKASLNLSSRTH